MKKALLLTGLLLVLVASMATAAGLSLNWGTACWGDTPKALTTFACTSNSTPANWKMTTSFKLDEEIADYINMSTLIEGVSETGAIPDWWKLSTTSECRGAISNVWSSLTSGATCADPFESTATTISAYGYLVPGVEIRIATDATLIAGVVAPGETEIFLNVVTIKNGKTVGTPKCDGCLTGMVFGLYEVLIGREFNDVIRLTEPYEGGNQCITWQRSFAGQPCNAPVPARNTTWGQVKSLYR